jgi:hypothetical protein
MDRVELLMRRRNVRAFIEADPVRISIVRHPDPVKNPDTGGFVSQPDGPPLPWQTARIVQNVRRYTDGLVNAEAGDIPNSQYRLIGMHTLDIKVDDEFTWLGENYKVTGIHEARQESVFAAIHLLGGDNRAEA